MRHELLKDRGQVVRGFFDEWMESEHGRIRAGHGGLELLDADRQRRMEESELHHDRAPLAGVVRELESQRDINRFLAEAHVQRNARFRQAIGVLVRMIMERRGWRKTGRKGSLGVRASGAARTPAHNTGGLAFWFIRAERYERSEGMPFRSVRERVKELEPAAPQPSRKRKRAARP